MSEFDPEALLRELVEHEVDFYVIGAVAGMLQGSPAATVDLDVMPRRDLENAERLAAALNALGARRRGDDADAVELEGADFLGWQTQDFDTDVGPLDVVPSAAAIGGYEDVATVAVKLGELTVRVLTLDEVIASKESLGRDKDTAALPALYAAREARRRRQGRQR